MANLLTQIASESLGTLGTAGRAKLTQVAVETLCTGGPAAGVPNPPMHAVATQVARECLAPTASDVTPPPCPTSERGNVDYDQIRLTARHGNGAQFQMSDGTGTAGNLAAFDACGNITDSGASTRASGGMLRVPVPASSDGMGIPGMFATDPEGNIYFCFTANRWLRIGPKGYSNTF